MAVERDSNAESQSEDDGDQENVRPPIDPDSDESDEAAEYADDDMSDAEEEEEKTTAAKRQRIAPVVHAEGNGRNSSTRKMLCGKWTARDAL